MKFVFRYRSGPDWMTQKAASRDFADKSSAEAFADGLRLGGAGNVSYEEDAGGTPTPLPRKGRGQYFCVVCNENPVNPHEGFDTCSNCVNKT